MLASTSTTQTNKNNNQKQGQICVYIDVLKSVWLTDEAPLWRPVGRMEEAVFKTVSVHLIKYRLYNILLSVVHFSVSSVLAL